MDDITTALAIALLLLAVWAVARHHRRRTQRKGSFIGLPGNAWPGPTMTFPLGEVWPYPSYY